MTCFTRLVSDCSRAKIRQRSAIQDRVTSAASDEPEMNPCEASGGWLYSETDAPRSDRTRKGMVFLPCRHVSTSLLEALARDGAANWLEVLERARVSAVEFIQRFGFSPSQPPANVAYNPAAMSAGGRSGLGGAGPLSRYRRAAAPTRCTPQGGLAPRPAPVSLECAGPSPN